MDLSCIISSGDLELYVLGMLPEDEAYKISQLAILFKEVNDEIVRIRQTLHLLSEEAQIEPSEQVRENFINTIRRLKEEDLPKQSEFYAEASGANKEAPTPEEHSKPAKVVPLGSGKSFNPLLLAASVVALVVCVGLIVYLYNTNNSYQQQLANIESKLQNNESELKNYQQTLAILQDPATQKIQLKSAPGKPDALAQVFWNKQTRQVILANTSLPVVPDGKQYQLWALINGKPVDAGMIARESKDLQQMKTFAEADAFAITLENIGGNPQPTTEPLVVGSTS